MTYLMLGIAIILNATANILMKLGMNRIGSQAKTPPANSMVLRMATNPFILTGAVLFGLALVAYNIVLTKLSLSIAYPVLTSLAYCLVVLASWLILNERILPLQVLGFAFIITGVWMVAAR